MCYHTHTIYLKGTHQVGRSRARMSLHPTPHQLVFNHSSTVDFIHRVFLRARLLRCWRFEDCWSSEYLKPPGPLYTHCFVNHLINRYAVKSCFKSALKLHLIWSGGWAWEEGEGGRGTGAGGGRGLRVEEDLQWLKLRISSMALSECRSIVFVLHAPWASQPVPALLS